MPTEWREVELGDVVDLLTGYPFRSQLYTQDPRDPRLVGGDNIVQGSLRWDTTRRWPRDMTTGLEQYWLAAGDVVLAMDRPWIAAGLKRAAIAKCDLPALLVQRTARLRGTSAIDQGFLRYLIGSREFTHYVVGVQTGTAVPHISPAQIRAFRFSLPPVDTQRWIARVLGSLDDKIELNRHMNETLEPMARALFKSWFVDFDPVRAKQEGRAPFGMDVETAALFPDAFEDSELGPIPKGWRVRSLDQIADFLNGLALQNFPANGPDSLPVIKIRELRTGIDANSARASRAIDGRYIVNDGDLLFSWSGSLVVTQWSGGPGALNQHLFKVSSTDFPKWFVMGWLFVHLLEFQGIAADKATTMGHIKRHHLTDAKVVVPPPTLITRLTTVAEPLLERLLLNELECRTLAELRDTLLPKLISGELRLPEAAALAEAAQ